MWGVEGQRQAEAADAAPAPETRALAPPPPVRATMLPALRGISRAVHRPLTIVTARPLSTATMQAEVRG